MICEVEVKEVTQTYVNETDELVHIGVNGETISATPSHPFYVYKFGWTLAGSLRAGDVLVLSNGELVIVEWVQHEILENPIKVYNFEVQDFHTYFVGECGVLVHNQCKNAWNQYQKDHKGEIKNDIIDKPKKGSALKVDNIPAQIDSNNKIVKEFPAVEQEHGFNNIVDNYAGYADKFDLDNATLYQLGGSLNHVEGRFEWIVQDGYVTHRRFVGGGKINGKPNKR